MRKRGREETNYRVKKEKADGHGEIETKDGIKCSRTVGEKNKTRTK